MALCFDESPFCVAQTFMTLPEAPKGCAFSPDGLVLLTATDRTLYVFTLPENSFQDGDGMDDAVAPPGCHIFSRPARRMPTPWSPAHTCAMAEPVYDFAFYPHFDSRTPATAAFLACCREQPILLYDAFGGGVRASYGGHNHKDELDTAYAVCFSGDGGVIYAGYDHAIMRFDSARAGRETHRWLTTPFKKSKQGQKGIVGAVAMQRGGGGGPAGSTCAEPGAEPGASPAGHGSSLLAAGAYDGSVWLYDGGAAGAPVCKLKYRGEALGGGGATGGGSEEASEAAGSTTSSAAAAPSHLSVENSEDAPLELGDAGVSTHKRRRLDGVHAEGEGGMGGSQPLPSTTCAASSRPGVTRVAWSPCGTRVYAGFRQAGAILAWDVRRPDSPVMAFARDAWSQQRIGFSLDAACGQLVTGGRDGVVRVYDTSTGVQLHARPPAQDAVNGVDVHPCGIVYARTVGQRHAVRSGEGEEEEDGGGGSTPAARVQTHNNTVSLWRTAARRQCAVE